MFSVEVASTIGNVMVQTTNNRGFTPEEIAERALDKIIAVSELAPPVIADQAHAYKDRLRRVLVLYMREAIRSHNVTVALRLREAGHSELTALLDD